ncbi:ATP-binding protein [Aquitalea sp. ASV11]|uniref:PAS domain-containing sensor histidine kinase n=1 Tax=Aquitalea sp. ASV11 TaxID=2795103 RepID=UPI0018ED0317|nr:ATP-binding protein [Aquitalea sp. ASV11]
METSRLSRVRHHHRQASQDGSQQSNIPLRLAGMIGRDCSPADFFAVLGDELAAVCHARHWSLQVPGPVGDACIYTYGDAAWPETGIQSCPVVLTGGRCGLLLHDGEEAIQPDSMWLGWLALCEQLASDRQRQQHAEQLQRNLLQLSEALFIAVPVPLLHIDASETILRINPSGRHLLCADIEVVNQLSECFPEPETYRALQGIIRQGFAGGEAFRFERTMRCMDGTERSLIIDGQLVRAGAAFGGMILAVTDMSHYHQINVSLDEARKQADLASQAKSSFLAVMSHEFRTPMHAILGMLELLCMGELDEEQRDYAQEIETAANKLLGMIDDVLAWTRLETASIRAEAQTFSINGLMDELLLSCRSAAAAKQLDVRYSNKLPADVLIKSDRRYLGKSIAELLDNAVKFTRVGQVSVSLDCLTATARDELVIRIEDSGIGMSKSELARVGELFTQTDGSTARSHDGLGLRLALARSLIGLLGGTLQLESNSGGGISATVQIPLRQGEKISIQPGGKNHPVLMIAPSAMLADVVGHLLQERGMQLMLATTLEDAALMISSLQPRRIIYCAQADDSMTFAGSRLSRLLSETEQSSLWVLAGKQAVPPQSGILSFTDELDLMRAVCREWPSEHHHFTVDHHALVALSGADVVCEQEILTMFLEDNADDLKLLWPALSNCRLPEARALLSRIATASIQIGAHHMSEVAQALHDKLVCPLQQEAHAQIAALYALQCSGEVLAGKA